MSYINDEKHHVYRKANEKGDSIAILFKETKISIEVPMDLFDELVVIRHAQLNENKTLERIQKRTYKKHYGTPHSCDALAGLLGKPRAVERVLKGGFKK